MQRICRATLDIVCVRPTSTTGSRGPPTRTALRSAGPDETALIRVVPLEIDRAGVARQLAICLSAAFSTGVWARTPIPVGPCSCPHSALGIIQQLMHSPVTVAAFRGRGAETHRWPLVGFVLGAVIDPAIIESYGLGQFGAAPGDGLLAYIGLVAHARGLCVSPAAAGGAHAPGSLSEGGTSSLARTMIDQWMVMPELGRCPRLFVRTRSEIPAAVHLFESLGFERAGGFDTQFLGDTQRRLVYCRSNTPVSGRRH